MPLTKNGTKAIKMPDASDPVYQAVAALPDDFPFDEWDEMSVDAQHAQIKKTKLTAEEQFVILNADLPIGMLKQIQEIQADNSIVWTSRTEKTQLLHNLWNAGYAKYAVQNNNHPFSHDSLSNLKRKGIR